MDRIVSWCLRNKSVVFLATLLLIASGVFATTRLNQELLPDIEFPVITISTPVPGAGPETVDEQVTQPLESAITGVENLEGIQANSAQGFSIVIAEFSLDADTEEAEAELQAAIENVSLPDQAVEPEVRRQSASEFPIMNVSLAAPDGDLAALTAYTQDEVVPRLEEVDGIGRVDVVGGSGDRIEVELDPAALEENGLPAAAVASAIQGANANAPVGSVDIEGLWTPVRVTGEVGDVEALRNLPISAASATGGAPGGAPPGAAPPGAGAAGASQYTQAPPEPVTLGAIADVRVAESNLSGIARTNGESSLGLNITKAPDANTVDVAAGVEEALAGARGARGGAGPGCLQLRGGCEGVHQQPHRGGRHRRRARDPGDLLLPALPARHPRHGRLPADLGVGGAALLLGLRPDAEHPDPRRAHHRRRARGGRRDRGARKLLPLRAEGLRSRRSGAQGDDRGGKRHHLVHANYHGGLSSAGGGRRDRLEVFRPALPHRRPRPARLPDRLHHHHPRPRQRASGAAGPARRLEGTTPRLRGTSPTRTPPMPGPAAAGRAGPREGVGVGSCACSSAASSSCSRRR